MSMAGRSISSTHAGRWPSSEVDSSARHRGLSSGTSTMHLVHSEINAVTSAIRKHARNTASSSFLGASSNATAGIGGPVAGGSSTASLLKGAIAATATSFLPAVPSVADSASVPLTPGGSKTHVRNATLDHAISSNGQDAQLSLDRSARLRYIYAEGRRDDGLAGLLNSFTLLRAQLREAGSAEALPQPLLVLPFLRVILSPRTTGPVTSIALQAVHRLLIYGIIRLDDDDAPQPDGGLLASRQDSRDPVQYLHVSSAQLAVVEIAHAVSHCRFEASDAVADELVLLRILAVMRELICADGGVDLHGAHVRRFDGRALADCLSDESVCEMMETGLSMCCQMRLSDLLRRTAEQTMTTMVRALFARLSTISLAEDEAISSDPGAPEAEPEHATLAADPVGEDALDLEREKKLRRMTMPDPKSFDVPAAGLTTPSAEISFLGQQEEATTDAETEKAVASIDTTAQHSRVDEKAGPVQSSASQAPAMGTPTLDGGDRTQAEEIIAVETQRYGLPAIKEVLRVIVSLLDPQNQQHTDAMRLLGLSMLCSVFEVAGRIIGRFPSLRAVVQDSACKHLFALTRSDNPTLVAYSLRTAATVFETMREHLKLQYELYLTYVLERLAPTFPFATEPWKDDASNVLALRRTSVTDVKGTPRAGTPDVAAQATPPAPPAPPLPRTSDRSPAFGETRELFIETLSLLLGTSIEADTDAFVELWINYDCDVDCENMFEKVVHFLCRAVYAANPLHPNVQETTQLFAMDAILNLVANMAVRQESEASGVPSDGSWPEDFPLPDQLAAQKSTKASILAGAAKFNEKPKLGLQYFEQNGFIRVDGEPKEVSVARFLKECPGLDKRLLGDYLSRPENEKILHAFLSLFDFSHSPIAEAMREMLEAFRLPGESQQINRITEHFAEIYFASKPADIRNQDAVYVLSYSIIMLNTDLHNPQNKRRMTIEDYRRNLRGVNDGKDFDPDFLLAIYDSIRRREIVMPEEHKGQLGFDYAWKELLRRSRKSGKLLAASTTLFDRAMFAACWRPIVASIAHAFSTFRDEHLLERAIGGFRQCAILASRFGMHELFDFMIQGLAGATGLLDANGVAQVTNNAEADFEGQRVTISPLSIKFGRNFKGQLAAVVLFTIANGNGHAVRKGWLPIFEIFKNLFINSLLTPSLGVMFEFDAQEARALPIRAKRSAVAPQDLRAQGGSGLFSAISSYLLSPYSVDREAAKPDVTVNEEAVESSLCTADCVASCRIEDLYAELARLDLQTRLEALQALRLLADRHTIERRAQLTSDGGAGGPDSGSGRSTPVQGASAAATLRANQPLPYEPSGAFVLELAVNLVCSADPSEAQTLWPLVAEHAMSIIGAPGQYHSLHVERAVVAILRLISFAAAETSLRQQIFQFLDQINGLPAEYRATVAVQVTAGLRVILASAPHVAVSKTEWNVVLSMLAIYGNARSGQAAHNALAALVAVIGADAVTVDNFHGIVDLLRDFARGAETILLDSAKANGNEPSRKTLTEKKVQKEYEDACQQRGPAAVQYLDQVKASIPRLVQMQGLAGLQTVWSTYWRPLMTAIAQQYTNGHRATRQAALVHLQRILLAPEVLETANGQATTTAEVRNVVHALFGEVLLPTLAHLLKPEVFQLDPGNEPGSMQETRIRASYLLSKVFLHYLGRLTDVPMGGAGQDTATAMPNGPNDQTFLQLWLAILDLFERFIQMAGRDPLAESTPENLKNVLLVMHASGLLVASGQQPGEAIAAPSTGLQQLSDLTFERIQRFLPNLQAEIFGAAAPVTATASPVVNNEATKESDVIAADQPTPVQPAAEEAVPVVADQAQP